VTAGAAMTKPYIVSNNYQMKTVHINLKDELTKLTKKELLVIIKPLLVGKRSIGVFWTKQSGSIEIGCYGMNQSIKARLIAHLDKEWNAAG